MIETSLLTPCVACRKEALGFFASVDPAILVAYDRDVAPYVLPGECGPRRDGNSRTAYMRTTFMIVIYFGRYVDPPAEMNENCIGPWRWAIWRSVTDYWTLEGDWPHRDPRWANRRNR